MSLDESTQAERDFFASRGRNTDALVAENPNLKADRITDEIPAREARDTGADTQQRDQREGEERGPAHVPGRQPSTPTETGAQPESTEARSGPIPDDQDEPGPPGSPHPKRVGWTRYQAALEQAKALEAERQAWLAEKQEWTDKFARVDERMKLINEAMTPAEQDPDPEPDKTQDAYAWMDWQDRQRQAQQQQFQQYLQQQAARDAENQLLQAYHGDAVRFAQQEPKFTLAYQYAIRSRDGQLQALEPWRTPQQRAEIVRQEELNQVRSSLERGLSPAEAVYNLARHWGFDHWLAQQQAQQQTPSNGGSPVGVNGAAAMAPPAAAPPNPGVPSAVQQVQNVIAGQAASRSLSQAGGGNAVTMPTSREISEWTDEQFNEWFSRAQGTGNKARLREVMGA